MVFIFVAQLVVAILLYAELKRNSNNNIQINDNL